MRYRGSEKSRQVSIYTERKKNPAESDLHIHRLPVWGQLNSKASRKYVDCSVTSWRTQPGVGRYSCRSGIVAHVWKVNKVILYQYYNLK